MSNSLLLEILCEPMPVMPLDQLTASWGNLIEKAAAREGFSLSLRERYYSTYRIALIFTVNQPNECTSGKLIKGPFEKLAVSEDGEWSETAKIWSERKGADLSRAIWIEERGGKRLAAPSTIDSGTLGDLFPKILESSLKRLELPVQMRWESGGEDYLFMRPVRNVLLLNGEEVIGGQLFGVPCGNRTIAGRYHRGTGREVVISSSSRYLSELDGAGVIIDQAKRRAKILSDLSVIGSSIGGVAKVNQELLWRLASTFENPRLLCGTFSRDYLSLPSEAVDTALMIEMYAFSFYSQEASLLPYFAVVVEGAPLDPSIDRSILSSFEFVVSERLGDVEHCCSLDLSESIDVHQKRLEGIVLHPALGNLKEKVDRVANLTMKFADRLLLSDLDLLHESARLSQFDRGTSLVDNIPSLHGPCGGHYARCFGLKERICNTIRDFIKPSSPEDEVPLDDHAAIIGLVDRLDDLVGLAEVFGLPSGSKDPYAMKRLSLGIVRILVAKEWDISLDELLLSSCLLYSGESYKSELLLDLKQYLESRLENWLTKTKALDSGVVRAMISRAPRTPFKISVASESFSKWMRDCASEWTSTATLSKRLGSFIKACSVSPDDYSILEALPSQDSNLAKLYILGGELVSRDDEACTVSEFDSIWVGMANFAAEVNHLFDSVYFDGLEGREKREYMRFLLYADNILAIWRMQRH